MSRGFNTAKAELFARRNGITYEEACRRLGRMGGRRRRARPILSATPQNTATPPPRGYWWQQD